MSARAVYAVAALMAAATPVLGAPWIITQYYELDLSTLDAATVIGDVTFSADIFTQTDAISLTQTPAPSPLAAQTTVQTVYDLTIVSKLMPMGAGKTLDLFGPIPEINYYIPLTYHALTTCSPGWSHTTSALIIVPPGVTPTPIATLPPSTDEALGQNYLIAASDIPSSSLTSLSSAYAPFYSDECAIPSYATAGALPTSGVENGNNNNQFDDCVPIELTFGGSPVGGGYECPNGTYWVWGLSLAGLICAWIFSFFGFFFICGLIENWFAFRSLSRGHAARRGLPISWAFMFPFLSCLFLIGSDRGFVAKPVDEQQVLQRRWDDLGVGSKLGEWLSWGFRWSYPPFLGPLPPRKGANVRITGQHGSPQMTQYPPQGQQGPPVVYTQHDVVGSTSPYGNSPTQPYGTPQPQQTSPYGSSSYPSPTAPYGGTHVGYK